jgi:hypothetical protein
MRSLKDYLDLSLYGTGQAKTWAELEAEIQSGECQIEWQGNRPVRVVKVACIEVLSHQGEQLIEDHQELADGRIRQRGLTKLSEKFKPQESPLAVARRALAEELDIHVDLELEEIGEGLDEKESFSYPGLLSRYHKFFFKVVLPRSLYKTEYIEIQPSKKTIFRWMPLCGRA